MKKNEKNRIKMKKNEKKWKNKKIRKIKKLKNNRTLNCARNAVLNNAISSIDENILSTYSGRIS